MIQAYEIADWPRRPWFHTKGTREKFACEDPATNRLYYFKESLNKPSTADKRGYSYPTEFWSEIIASKVGQLLGFNLLDYNIARTKDNIGCICQDMLRPRQNLMEGFQFLTAVERNFLPDADYKSRKLYDFQLIEKALRAFGLDGFLPNLVETILFDSIVGNSDRHQENWGFIYQVDEMHRQLLGKHRFDTPTISELLHNKPVDIFTGSDSVINTPKGEGPLIKALRSWFRPSKNKEKEVSQPVFIDQASAQSDVVAVSFSPIYDSGSSLGRELTNEAIGVMLRDKSQLDKYIKRGKSEIHWLKEKKGHVELVLSLSESYASTIRNRLRQVQMLYNSDGISNLLKSTESFIPEGAKFDPYRLTSDRQEFMSRLIETRIQLLLSTFSSLL